MKPAFNFAVLALLFQALAEAATVYRCVDSKGQVSFSQLGCPTDHASAMETADNPTPSTRGTARMAPTRSERPVTKREGEEHRQVTVVGEPDDGCGNLLTDRDRRVAILRKKVQPGMTQADVESALGKPDKITGNNAKLRYHYDGSPKRVVSFDERGCVPRKS